MEQTAQCIVYRLVGRRPVQVVVVGILQAGIIELLAVITDL